MNVQATAHLQLASLAHYLLSSNYRLCCLDPQVVDSLELRFSLAQIAYLVLSILLDVHSLEVKCLLCGRLLWQCRGPTHNYHRKEQTAKVFARALSACDPPPAHLAEHSRTHCRTLSCSSNLENEVGQGISGPGTTQPTGVWSEHRRSFHQYVHGTPPSHLKLEPSAPKVRSPFLLES